jgi:hypothetical protein
LNFIELLQVCPFYLCNIRAKSFPCPIDGCEKIFQKTRGGWDAHVGSLKQHPQWYPEVIEPMQRTELFRREFTDWFKK